MLRLIGIIVFALGTAGSLAAQDSSVSQGLLGATYAELLPEQKALVDDWFRRFAEIVKKPVSAEEGYDSIPLSSKTTFSAVTHALIRTPLTDQSGASLGISAITLIERLDTVAGKIPGARSDRQFRMYVELKPGALEILDKSREFGRGPDNTVYHEGFPISYRSRKGTPSLQISAAKDGKRADIDVDYRSSKFPVFLINGHLTASNSDVRSGDNDQRHNQQWAGLPNWWRNFLGLPIFDMGSQSESVPASDPAIKANAKPEVAVHDFLNSWLVDQRPELAAPYFAESAFTCIEVEGGQPADAGMARFSVLMNLRAVNQRIGKVGQLSDVITGVRLAGPRNRAILQPYESEFMLYDVREDLAEQMKCLNKVDPTNLSAKAAKSKAFGKYVASVFKLKTPGQISETVAALWARQDGYWKLISYDLEPEFERYRVPDTTPPSAATSALTYVAGDKDQIRAATDFLNKWLVRGQSAQAFQYLSPSAYLCANLYRDEDTPAPGSPAEAGRLLLAGMDKVVPVVGPVRKLEEAIAAPVVSHPDVRLVKHSHSRAFALASVPDHMAAATSCQERQAGQEIYVQEPTTGKVYGNYYATGFRLFKAVEDAAILWCVWAKESGQWKIVSYFLITP